MQNIISSIAPVIGLGSASESAAESGQEPRSGVKGAGTAADPYDAGNSEGKFTDSGKSGSAVDKSTHPESLTKKDSLTEPGTSTDQTGRSPVTGTLPSSSLQKIINTIAPVIGFGSSTGGGQEPRSNDGLYDAGNASGDKGLSTDDSLGGATAGIANLTTKDSASTEPKTVQNESIGESSKPSSSVGTKDHSPSNNSDGLPSQSSSLGNPGAASYHAGSTDSQPITARKTAPFPDSYTPEFPNSTSGSSRYEKPSSLDTSRPDPDNIKPQAATSLGESESQVIQDPSSEQKSAPKHQGADRPLEEPVGEQADALAKDKAYAERAQARGPTASHSPLIPGLPSNDKSGSPADDKKDNKKDNISGTGEKYVKSTGLAAQGGNFDAAAPGAGKEADRLLEAAGIKHGDNFKGLPTSPSQTDEHVPVDSTEKVSLKDKIKGKLHIGKH